MELKINNPADIQNVLKGWSDGSKDGLTSGQAFAIVKAIENYENSYDVTISIDPGTLVELTITLSKASDIFDIDDEVNANDFLEFATDTSMNMTYGTSDGGIVVKTSNDRYPFVYFSFDICGYGTIND